MFTKNQLINAVLEGIIGSNNFFEKITTGSWLNDAGVESVLQTKIAESIFNLLPKDKDGFLSEAHIMMECNLGEIIDNSGSNKKRSGIPKLVSGAKRVDLLIYDKEKSPLVPIEIKRNAAKPGFTDDAARIIGILGRSDHAAGGSVKYGLICGFIFGKGEAEKDAIEILDSKRKNCAGYVINKIPEQNFELSWLYDAPQEYEDPDDDNASIWWAGGAICVYLRRKH